MRSIKAERWFEFKLDTSERPKTKYEYFVTGRGDFPIDMLRYDGAWPASGEDAARLVLLDDRRDLRSVRLRSYNAPTLARWMSFGWSVGTHSLQERNQALEEIAGADKC